MFVLTKIRDTIVNLDKAASIYVGSDGRTIKAIMSETDKMYKLGIYQSEAESKAALEELFLALKTGQRDYRMPDDRQIIALLQSKGEERPMKFAANGKKPVRRGGS